MAGVLDGIYNGAPDLRVAVTTGTTGALRTSSAVPTGVFVDHRDFTDGSLDTSYSGAPADALGSLMAAGATSTAPNMLLARAQQALGGFTRPSAALGLLVITAADDQSTGDVASYAGAIASPGSPVLVSVIHVDDAPRLVAFAGAFGERDVTTLDAYTMESISAFAQLFAPAPPEACLSIATSDVDRCEMSTSYDGATSALPECGDSALDATTPCWQPVADSTCRSGIDLVLGGGYGMYHPRIFGTCPGA